MLTNLPDGEIPIATIQRLIQLGTESSKTRENVSEDVSGPNDELALVDGDVNLRHRKPITK